MLNFAGMCIVFVWLAIAAGTYIVLWDGFLHRFGRISVIFFNVVIAGLLSPGLYAAGHGAFPFPAGLVVLFSGKFDLDMNAILWMCTFVLLSIADWMLRRDGKSSH